MLKKDEALRADARANRDRIVDVAREMLSSDPDVSFNSIAKAAGVGHGTLYRHFPNREALVVAVYGKEIDALVALPSSLLAKHPPLRAFRAWCERLAKSGRMKHGIADLLRSAVPEQEIHESYWQVLAAVRQLIRACDDAGVIVKDLDAEDALIFLSGLTQMPPTAAGVARGERLIAIFFRGVTAAVAD